MAKKTPNPEQLSAVFAFAQKEGREWKSRLTSCWMKAGYPGHDKISHLLQQVRNQFGPQWLESISYAALEKLVAATTVPEDFPVKVLTTFEEKKGAKDLATCGTCGRSWDDGISTSMTPAPSGRCPFEPFHV